MCAYKLFFYKQVVLREAIVASYQQINLHPLFDLVLMVTIFRTLRLATGRIFGTLYRCSFTPTVKPAPILCALPVQ